MEKFYYSFFWIISKRQESAQKQERKGNRKFLNTLFTVIFDCNIARSVKHDVNLMCKNELMVGNEKIKSFRYFIIVSISK